MVYRLSHVWRLTLPLLAVVALGGCASDPFAALTIGQTQRQALAQALGPQAVETSDGYILETQTKWPTVISVVHAAAPVGGTVQSKTGLTASVVHMIAVQTLNVEMVYEGPLPDDLADALRSPDGSQNNEFLAQLIDFARDRMRLGLTEKWKDVEQLRDDPYRSRFVGVINFAWNDLRGRGKLQASELAVDVHGASSTLNLRKLEGDTYRIDTRSTVALGPLPVL
ncbi:MAG: hypothetical protein JXL80_11915 [Planctomycetes bacterium]|nr:hypothetical protein [Planctomycetota bacterium]